MSNTNTNNSQKTLDKRIIRSKRAIRDAFFAELQKKEYSKITITDIAIAAGINRKTFYSYYDGVESLFEEIETELINTVLSAVHLKLGDGIKLGF